MPHELPLRECIICGKTYKPTSTSQKCCSVECRKIHRKAYKRKIRTYTPRKTKKSGLVEINELARKCGMTYGQYMAMLYRKEDK